MSEEAKKEITVKIKLPDEKVIEVKTSPEATFKEFLEVALNQYPELKNCGYVKFEYKCNIWNKTEGWVTNQEPLQKKIKLVFNKVTLKEASFGLSTEFKLKEKTMSIGNYLFIEDGAMLSLVLADDDPCAINLNDLDEIMIRKDKMPKRSISKKTNWPRIIVGIVNLSLSIAAIITFVLFLFNILTFVVIPVVCTTLFIVGLIIWATWNLFIREDWRGGLIYKLDPSLNNEENMIDMNSYERDNNNMQLERYSDDPNIEQSY